MGENCTGANMYRFLTAFTYSLEKAGVKLKANLQDNFKKEIEKNGFTVTIKD